MYWFWQSGPVVKYHADGTKRLEGKLRWGKSVGVWRTWFESGILASQTEYVSGRKHGKQLNFHPNGQKFVEAAWVNGKRHGTIYSYNYEGRLYEEEDFDNDKLVAKRKR